MSSSLILQRFSSILENPEVLNKPEDFLGPNTEKLLEFWNKIDELSEEQLKVVKERYDAFFNETLSEWDKARELAREASKEVVGSRYTNEAGRAAWGVAKTWVAADATREIIGGVESPVFLPMFDNL